MRCLIITLGRLYQQAECSTMRGETYLQRRGSGSRWRWPADITMTHEMSSHWPVRRDYSSSDIETQCMQNSTYLSAVSTISARQRWNMCQMYGNLLSFISRWGTHNDDISACDGKPSQSVVHWVRPFLGPHEPELYWFLQMTLALLIETLHRKWSCWGMDINLKGVLGHRNIVLRTLRTLQVIVAADYLHRWVGSIFGSIQQPAFRDCLQKHQILLICHQLVSILGRTKVISLETSKCNRRLQEQIKPSRGSRGSASTRALQKLRTPWTCVLFLCKKLLRHPLFCSVEVHHLDDGKTIGCSDSPWRCRQGHEKERCNSVALQSNIGDVLKRHCFMSSK